MTKREELIKQVSEFDEKWFNQDQKEIAIKLLENCKEDEAQGIFNFVKFKRRTGFAFDYSPEPAKGRIINPNLVESIGLGENHNKLFIGDNYNTLKVLQLTHTGKIDIIYIDPPYNTESAKNDGNQSSKENVEAKSFVYKDKFGRTGWLNMLKNRLDLAFNLLSEEGIIFISIDDSEHAYLKVLMDDIFGEHNFIANINILDNLKGKSNDNFISYTSHYVLSYAKNKDLVDGFNLVIDVEKEFEKKYSEIDEEGNNYTYNGFKKTGASSLRVDRPSMFYPIIVNDNILSTCSDEDYELIKAATNDKDIDKLIKEINNKYEYETIIWPEHKGTHGRWVSGFEGFKRLVRLGQIDLNSKNGVQQKKYPSEMEEITNSIYGTPKNFVYKKEFSLGTDDLKKLSLEFTNAKSVSLIKYLIQLVKNNESKTILDFYAGSGTTGQAVLEMNESDGGNRSYILGTNNENNIADNTTVKRLKSVTESHNSTLDIFEIEDNIIIENSISNDELSKVETKIVNNLKIIDGDYSSENIDLYYDLSALNPLEDD